jgi:hypothetical protein
MDFKMFMDPCCFEKLENSQVAKNEGEFFSQSEWEIKMVCYLDVSADKMFRECIS